MDDGENEWEGVSDQGIKASALERSCLIAHALKVQLLGQHMSRRFPLSDLKYLGALHLDIFQVIGRNLSKITRTCRGHSPFPQVLSTSILYSLFLLQLDPSLYKSPSCSKIALLCKEVFFFAIANLEYIRYKRTA